MLVVGNDFIFYLEFEIERHIFAGYSLLIFFTAFAPRILAVP